MTTSQRLDNFSQFELTAEQQALKERARELAREVIEPRAAIGSHQHTPGTTSRRLRRTSVHRMPIPGLGAKAKLPRLWRSSSRVAQVCGVPAESRSRRTMDHLLLNAVRDGAVEASRPDWSWPRQARDLRTEPGREALRAKWTTRATSAARATSSTQEARIQRRQRLRLHPGVRPVFDETSRDRHRRLYRVGRDSPG